MPAAVSTSYISRIQDLVYHCNMVKFSNFLAAKRLNGQVLSGPDFAAIKVGHHSLSDKKWGFLKILFINKFWLSFTRNNFSSWICFFKFPHFLPDKLWRPTLMIGLAATCPNPLAGHLAGTAYVVRQADSKKRKQWWKSAPPAPPRWLMVNS